MTTTKTPSPPPTKRKPKLLVGHNIHGWAVFEQVPDRVGNYRPVRRSLPRRWPDEAHALKNIWQADIDAGLTPEYEVK